MASDLTHFDENGRPRMVDISGKGETERFAVARGKVRFAAEAYSQMRSRGVKKGDVCSVAELAGVMAAKKTSDLIPLCHPLSLASVSVEAVFNDAEEAIDITASVRVSGQTGVEIEALTAVSVACLTVYDMAKSIDKSMTIADIQLVEKSGGQSGDYRR